MTKEELIQFLKTNLSVEVRTDYGKRIVVEVYLGDEIISNSEDRLID